MLRGLRTALVVLMLACLGAAPAAVRPAFAQGETADSGLGLREAERSVVRIMVLHLDANDQPIALVGGTGFVVAPGKIVTNNHVVQPVEGSVKQLYYVVPDRFAGTEGKDAQVLQTWPEADLALLSSPEIAAPSLKIAATPPGKEATVRALGYPGVTDSMRNLTLAKRLEPSEPYVTSGSIALFSDTAPGGEAIDTIFHTAPIDHGNSGGPLVDECNRVIGVNTWGAADTLADDGQVESHQGQFAAIRSTVLAKFLDNSGVHGDIDYGPCVKAPTVDPALAAEVDKANAAATQALAAAQKAEDERDQILRWGVILIGLGAAVGALVMFLRWRQASAPAPAVPVEAHTEAAAPAPAAKKPLPIAIWALLAVFVVALVGLWLMTHPKPAAAPAPAPSTTVTLACTLDPARSFNPIPGAGSLTFGFDAPIACVNGRTPYEKNAAGGYSHITVMDKTHSVSKMELSGDLKTFTRRDFVLSDADYAAFSAGRTSLGAIACPIPNDAASAKATNDGLEKIRTLSASYLEVESSRVMTWHCAPQTQAVAAPAN